MHSFEVILPLALFAASTVLALPLERRTTCRCPTPSSASPDTSTYVLPTPSAASYHSVRSDQTRKRQAKRQDDVEENQDNEEESTGTEPEEAEDGDEDVLQSNGTENDDAPSGPDGTPTNYEEDYPSGYEHGHHYTTYPEIDKVIAKGKYGGVGQASNSFIDIYVEHDATLKLDHSHIGSDNEVFCCS